MLTASSTFLKQSCSVFTSVTSALEVNVNAMRYIQDGPKNCTKLMAP